MTTTTRFVRNESNQPESVWLIFPTRALRSLYLRHRWLTMHSSGVLLNYAIGWQDVNGWGLHLTHADWPGAQGYMNL